MGTTTARRITTDEGSLDQYLREISQYPLINRQDEVNLAQHRSSRAKQNEHSFRRSSPKTGGT